MINLFVDNDGAVPCGYIGINVLNDRLTKNKRHRGEVRCGERQSP